MMRLFVGELGRSEEESRGDVALMWDGLTEGGRGGDATRMTGSGEWKRGRARRDWKGSVQFSPSFSLGSRVLRCSTAISKPVKHWIRWPNLTSVRLPWTRRGSNFQLWLALRWAWAIYAVLQARRRDTLSNSARIILVLFAEYGSMRDHGAHPALPVS